MARFHTPANTSAGASACMPPSSSNRSSMFIAGSMSASELAISSGGMLPTVAMWMPSTASTPSFDSSAGITTRSSTSWCRR